MYRCWPVGALCPRERANPLTKGSTASIAVDSWVTSCYYDDYGDGDDNGIVIIVVVLVGLIDLLEHVLVVIEVVLLVARLAMIAGREGRNPESIVIYNRCPTPGNRRNGMADGTGGAS